MKYGLTACDNHVWKFVKDVLSRKRYRSDYELRSAVLCGILNINPCVVLSVFSNMIRVAKFAAKIDDIADSLDARVVCVRMITT